MTNGQWTKHHMRSSQIKRDDEGGTLFSPPPLPSPPILSESVLSTSGNFSKICLPEPFKFLATDVLRIPLPINQ